MTNKKNGTKILTEIFRCPKKNEKIFSTIFFTATKKPTIFLQSFFADQLNNNIILIKRKHINKNKDSNANPPPLTVKNAPIKQTDTLFTIKHRK